MSVTVVTVKDRRVIYRAEHIYNKRLHFGTGWIHLKLVEKANEGNIAAKDSGQREEAKSGLGAAIERLEENLNK